MESKYREEVINPGDRASRLGKEVCFKSHGNNSAVKIIPQQEDNFRGPVDFRWRKTLLLEMIEGVLNEKLENDGAGGKPQFFTIIAEPDNIKNLGREIIQMTAVDVAAKSGAFPVIMLNQMDFRSVTEKNFHLVEAALEGYSEALAETGLINITGEMAIMKNSITCFMTGNLDNTLVLTWSGACLGLSRPDRYLDPKNVKSGMPIVGFHENGYRCNGGGIFTNIIMKKWGTDIDEIRANNEAMKFIRQLTIPSVDYSRTLTRLMGWNPDGSVRDPLAQIVLAAHITGGGVWGKFGEVLPPGIRAILNHMPTPSPVLLQAQELGEEVGVTISDHSAYGDFHGGCGLLAVAKTHEDAEIAIEEAAKDGVTASVVGETIKKSNGSNVIITSQFSEVGKILYSNKPF